MRRLFAGSALALLAAVSLAPAAQAQIIAGNNFSPAGILPLSCTLTAAGSCGPFYPIAGRPAHYVVDGATVSGVASCQLIRELDGVTASPITVTAGASTTTMNNPSISSNRVSEDFEEDQYRVPYFMSCGATFNGTTYGSFTSGQIIIGISQ